ncbi:MAG: hypothetical protein ACOCWQ_06300 [Nanoarchaeota archaeon]
MQASYMQRIRDICFDVLYANTHHVPDEIPSIGITDNWSYYGSGDNEIGINRHSVHRWDDYFEETAHALRYSSIVYQSGIDQLQHTIVDEFFGGLGRMIGRMSISENYRHSAPQMQWHHITAFDKTRHTVRSPSQWRAHLLQSIERHTENRSQFKTQEIARTVAIGHCLGYLMAENYPIPSPPTTALHQLFELADSEVWEYVFPSIRRRSPALHAAWLETFI